MSSASVAIQKAVELLLGKVQRVQHGVVSQVLMQPCLLHGAQLPVMAAHEAEQPPVPASLGVVLLPQLQEVLINAQYLRTGPARELRDALLHKRLIPALYRRRANAMRTLLCWQWMQAGRCAGRAQI